jgi:hypothetical protein
MIKSEGRLLAFFERPIAAGLGVVTLLVWGWPVMRRLVAARAAPTPRSPASGGG